MGTAAAIGGSALIGGAASLYGARQSGKAQEKAGRLQAEASRYAADIGQKQYEQTREDQLPWMQAGERALGTLETMMSERPSMEDYQMSDYAEFMRGEGLRGLEAKSRAGGYFNTGATSREMLDYSRNVAGQDYQNYLNQYYQSLNPYMQLSGTGQQQSNILGQQGQQQASQQGQYAQQAAGAEAQGIIGKQNAYNQGLQNITGLAMGGMQYLGGMGGGSGGGASFQTPQNWASQSTGTGFSSAWEV